MAVKGSSTAARVLVVFEAVAAHQPVGVAALSRMLGIDKSAVQQNGIKGFTGQTPESRTQSSHMGDMNFLLPRLLEHLAGIPCLCFIFFNQ